MAGLDEVIRVVSAVSALIAKVLRGECTGRLLNRGQKNYFNVVQHFLVAQQLYIPIRLFFSFFLGFFFLCPVNIQTHKLNN